MSVFDWNDPSKLPLTAGQKQRQEEQLRRSMRLAQIYIREHPPKTMEQIALEPPEICAVCGEIAEAHWSDAERLYCPERTVN